MNTEYELLKKHFLNFVRTKEKYIELLSDESVDIEEIAELIVYKDEQIKELKKELESFEQINFIDLCDGSRTILYMKKEKYINKENVGDENE